MDLNFEVKQARETLAIVQAMWDNNADPYEMIGHLEGRVQLFIEACEREMSVNAG